MDYEITSGIDHSAGIKVLIYGVEGIGKTTLASRFPDPLFIDTEGSTARYENIKRLPKPKDWNDINKMIDFVSEKKPCKTLVIDTFDWAEQAEVAGMLKDNNWKSIETPGYGKGYVVSAERIAAFLTKLEKKLVDRGINVVLNCHSHLKKFESPEEAGSYDRYELKLGAKTGSRTAPLVKEWADMILFCNYRTFVEVANDGFGNKKARATGGTERVMYTTRSAVWDAKNRFGLPDEMPMSFKPLAKIFETQPDPVPEPVQELVKEVTEGGAFEPEVIVAEALKSVFDKAIPEKVIALCSGAGFGPEDIQLMLFNNKIVAKRDFPLEKVPEKFWNNFVTKFDEKWKAELQKAAEDNELPF